MTLNLNQIADDFAILAGLGEEEVKTYLGLILSAKSYYERLLLRDFSDDDERALYEYACACKVYYDYCVYLCSQKSTLPTASGSVFSRVSSDKTVRSAELMMYNALASLPKGLVNDDGFIFEGMVG